MRSLNNFFVIFFIITNLIACTKTKEDSLPINVYFPYHSSSSEYDPVKIVFSYHYHILENIYSPLIEIDTNGSLIGGLAKSFYWKENEAHIELRDNLKTIDGHAITAEDAAYSLKRVLLLKSNTHGNLNAMLCGIHSLKKIQDECEGIVVRDNTLILKTDAKKPFLFSMLAAIDFAVIPKSSIAHDSLKITDYRNTSGLYFISKSSDDRLEFEINKNHYHYSANIPAKVVFAKHGIEKNDSVTEGILNKKIDLASTASAPIIMDEILKSGQHLNKMNLHKTIEIMYHVAFFSDQGMKKTSTDERLSILRKFKEKYLEVYKKEDGYVDVSEVFPSFGEAGLDTLQKNLWKKNIERIGTVNESVQKTLVLGVISNNYEIIKQIVSSIFPDWKIVNLREKNTIAPDILIGQLDTGFMEDIGLLSFAISFDVLGVDSLETKEWLKKYMTIDSKEMRIKQLKEFHFNSLMAGKIMPLVATPYFFISSKEWQISLSPFYSNLQLWKIHK